MITDSDTATSTPTAKAAKTRKSQSQPTCEECLWPLPLVLTEVWVLGRRRWLCANPWACHLRQISLREHHRLS